MALPLPRALLAGVRGLHGPVIRIGPSMLITEAEVDDALGRPRPPT